MRHQLELIGDAADGSDYIARGFGWFVVFYVPSTASSLRDDNPIYCPFAKDMKLGFTPFPSGIEPGRHVAVHYTAVAPR